MQLPEHLDAEADRLGAIAEPIVGRRYRVTFGHRQPREIVGTLHSDFSDEGGRWLRFVECEIVKALPATDQTLHFESITGLRPEP